MAFEQHDIATLGFFSWAVPENCLTGDEMFARLYGFTLDQVLNGVTAEEVIARIIPGDRERVAFETHSAILTGVAGLITYTAFDGTEHRHLGSIGRCLRDIDGVPSFYTGTVFERPDRRASLPEFPGHNVVPLRHAHRSDVPKS